MRQTVVGVFDRYAAARQAAQKLRDSGFGDSVYVTDDMGSVGPDGREDSAERREDTGVFAHVRQFFADLFGDDDREVSPYAEALRRGGAVVKVEVDEEQQAESARRTLEAAGAVDIEERAEQWRTSGWQEGTSLMPGTGAQTSAEAGIQTGADTIRDTPTADTMPDTTYTATDTPAGTTRGRRAAVTVPLSPTEVPSSAKADEVIPVVTEEMQVGKRVVNKGGVRVYARTVETPVQEEIDLRIERAEVDRRPVNRPASAADLEQLGERTIEVRETAEEPVVQKQARVVEEVVVGKRVESRTEQVRDTVRSTEVDVEPMGAQGSAGEAPWRSHFDTNYAQSGGRWEDYEPAYLFGDSVRTDARYAGRDWDEVEPDLQRDWEARGSGPWQRFRAAVRHAWDRMTD